MDMHAYNRWRTRRSLVCCKCRFDPEGCEWCAKDNPHSRPQETTWEERRNTPWPKELSMEEWELQVSLAPRITESPYELLFWASK